MTDTSKVMYGTDNCDELAVLYETIEAAQSSCDSTEDIYEYHSKDFHPDITAEEIIEEIDGKEDWMLPEGECWSDHIEQSDIDDLKQYIEQWCKRTTKVCYVQGDIVAKAEAPATK